MKTQLCSPAGRQRDTRRQLGSAWLPPGDAAYRRTSSLVRIFRRVAYVVLARPLVQGLRRLMVSWSMNAAESKSLSP